MNNLLASLFIIIGLLSGCGRLEVDLKQNSSINISEKTILTLKSDASQPNLTVSEGSSIVIIFILNKPLLETVNFSLDITGPAGEFTTNYFSTEQMKLALAPGITSGMFRLNIKDDITYRSNTQWVFKINSDREDIESNDNLTFTIIDNDPNPIFAPTALLSGLPQSPSNSSFLNVSVGGVNLETYQYKIGPALTTSCEIPLGYSNDTPNTLSISDALGPQPDGLLKLCVVGKAIDGNAQQLTNASSVTWEKRTIAKLPTALTLIEPTASPSKDSTPTFQVAGFDLDTEVTLFRSSADCLSATNAISGTTLVTKETQTNMTTLNLPAGVNELFVQVKDSLGNVRCSDQAMASYQFTYATKIVSGLWHYCALINDGTVTCWGDNSEGQLGNGNFNRTFEKQKVTGINNARDIAAGKFSTCVILTDNSVRCWGSNTYGMLGNGSATRSSVPVTVTGITDALRLPDSMVHYSDSSAWDRKMCVILQNKTVKCWGYLGATNSTPVLQPTLTDVDSISLDYYDACTFSATNGMNCWGNNFGGSFNAPVNIAVPNAVRATPSGIGYIALDQSGNIWRNLTTTPTIYASISSPKQIAGMCIVLNNGTVTCYYNGQDTYASIGVVAYPIVAANYNLVPNISGIESMASTKIFGGDIGNSCGILSASGQIACWGNTSTVSVGTGYSISDSSPKLVANLSSTSKPEIIVSGRYHACLNHLTNGVSCWGSNTVGATGIPSGQKNIAMPTAVTDINSYQVTQLTASVSSRLQRPFTCVLLSDKSARCWGDGSYGELGNGLNSIKLPPQVVQGLTNIQMISAGGDHACAIEDTGSGKRPYCWGDNSSGNLGIGSNTPGNSNVPVVVLSNDVNFDSDALQIAANYQSTCTLHANGKVFCWGAGFDSVNFKAVEVTGFGTSPIQRIYSGGGFHFCALLTDATVKCWGANSTGQLGNSTVNNSYLTAVSVSSMTDVAEVALAYNLSCLRKVDKTVHCWGSNRYYTLYSAIGHNSYSSVPVQITMPGNITKILGNGSYENLFFQTDTGDLYHLGYNAVGNRGDGLFDFGLFSLSP